MQLNDILRDLKSIDGGRWVDASDLPELGDIRVKVRGASGDAISEKTARLERDGMDRAEAYGKVIREDCFLDIDGLFDGDRKLTAEDVRPNLDDPEWSRLAIMIVQAVGEVDKTTKAKAEALAKN